MVRKESRGLGLSGEPEGQDWKQLNWERRGKSVFGEKIQGFGFRSFDLFIRYPYSGAKGAVRYASPEVRGELQAEKGVWTNLGVVSILVAS